MIRAAPRVQLRATAAQWRALRRHLLADASREQLAFLLCGRHQAPDGNRVLLLREVVPAPPAALEAQHAGRVTATQALSRAVLRLARDEQLELLDAHSHPFSRGEVGFSATDGANEALVARYVAERLPGRWYGALVFSHRDVDGRLWTAVGPDHGAGGSAGGSARGSAAGGVALAPVPLERITVYGGDGDDGAGHGMEVIQPRSARAASRASAGADAGEDAAAWAPFARQVQAVGPAGQRRLLATHVAVIGAGGLGSAVAVTLAHLGIGALTLVDPDSVEPSNLNRLYGATWEDAASGQPKVEVLARYARAVRPQLRLTAIREALAAPEAWRAVAGCDAMLVCVDNDAARLVANRLAAQYLLPMIDLATGIETDSGDGEGAIREAGGQVRTVLPGDFCLECIHGLDGSAAGRERVPAALRALYEANGYVTTEAVPAPAVATLNLAVAAEGTSELLALLTGVRPRRAYLLYDWRAARWTQLAAARRATCVVCGPGAYAGAGDGQPAPAVAEVWLPPYPRPGAVVLSVPAAGAGA